MRPATEFCFQSGGFTALACLADCDVFKAAVMLYGISDVKLLAGDSSKVTSRHLPRCRQTLTLMTH